MQVRTELRLLQGAIAVAGLVPVGAGAAGMLLGDAMMGPASATAGLDSHVRYLSGLLLGIGLLFWGMVPSIGRRAVMVRTLTFVVVVGGLARLYGFAVHGLPDLANTLAIVMELGVTPALCAWQARLARLLGR